MKHKIRIVDLGVQMTALKWGALYEFKGEHTYALTYMPTELVDWAWDWEFENNEDAVLFKLKFA